ncbi:MAG: hypothetical protein GXY36_16225 [Chloroflexi bacterium]|nr:hypothetical protein [Chloroflexota bacterium]
MSPLEPEKSNPWVKQIEDAIASNSALREGLHDNEAMPLIDWGAERAQQIGQRMAAQATVAPDSEEVAETAYTLGRLMTRITWVVVYRNKKDAAWLTRTFNTINQLSQELYGPDAATLSEAEIADWIATHSQFSNGELVKQLIERLTPAGSEAAPPAPTTPTLPGREDAASPAPGAPTLPGREDASAPAPGTPTLPGREDTASPAPGTLRLPGRDASPPTAPAARTLPGRSDSPPAPENPVPQGDEDHE